MFYGNTVTRSYQCRGRGASFSQITQLFGIVLTCVVEIYTMVVGISFVGTR
jgi:hypothetical protein